MLRGGVAGPAVVFPFAIAAARQYYIAAMSVAVGAPLVFASATIVPLFATPVALGRRGRRDEELGVGLSAALPRISVFLFNCPFVVLSPVAFSTPSFNAAPVGSVVAVVAAFVAAATATVAASSTSAAAEVSVRGCGAPQW